MKITNIKIDDFGCLSGKTIDLSPAFNLASGDNESGKSTLLAFIKFIFYGLPRKTQENTAERERSLSWSNNTAAGSLTFSADSGDTYTVERRVTRRMGEKRESVSDSLRIIDEKTGLEVHKGECPGELFLGVSASVFESTCFIRQSGVTGINADDLSAALENILLSADESIDLQKSLDRLDGARKLLLHKSGKGGSLYELESEGEELSLRLARAKADYAKILSKTDEVNDRRRETLEKRRELDRLDDVFSAMSKAALVKRFDALHEKEAELASLEKEHSELCEKNSSVSGFLPDAEYIAGLNEALSAFESAKDEYSRACRILDEAGTEKAREESQGSAACPLSADEIRSRGGADKLCEEIKDLFALSDKKKKTGKTLLTVFIIGLVLGSAMAALSFIIPMPSLLYAGLGVGALALTAVILSVISNSSSKKLRERAEATLSELGAPPSQGLTVSDRITLLHSVLVSCFDRETALRELESRFALASSAAKLRSTDLDSVTARAESLISKWKRPEGISDISAALRQAIADSKAFVSERDSISAKITDVRSKADAIRGGLDGINEADLRARVPAAAIEAYENGDEGEITRRRKFCSDALRAMNEKAHETEKELLRLENETENPARLSVLLEENRKKYDAEKLKFDAIIMAQSALFEAGSDLRNSVSPLLRKGAETYMSALTDEKYRNMGIGDKYSLTAKSGDSGVRSVELLSAGTKDSAYIALRLALLEVIFREEKPFLAVDEALAQLDDKRAAAALRLLSSYCDGGGQCILFTCHSREEKLLENITKAKIIKL